MNADVIIIGAGMAGASLAAAIGDRASVLLLEAEAQPGYHATGRSAAFWSETYGGPLIQPLTTASLAALSAPVDGHPHGFLEPRGALHIGGGGDLGLRDAMAAAFAGSGVALSPLDRTACEAIVPGLRDGWTIGLLEPSCAAIDVAGLHAHYLSIARRAGARLATRQPVTALYRDGDGWRVETATGEIHRAAIVVNAAGAWAGDIAIMAGALLIPIAPMRRTMVQLRLATAVPPSLPLVIDLAGKFYFKPEPGNRLWLSPHDETAAPASDVAPEELDVAIAIERLSNVVDWDIAAVERRWAGLRSFAPDRLPVYGFDPVASGFFWCAGQGGFGIQTAPAAAAMAAALLLDGALPGNDDGGVDPARYAPDRFI